MKAWLFTDAHRPLELVEREAPSPGPGEVLVEVRGSGLCHSDVGCLEGILLPHMPKQPPIILGHEVAGVITKLGTGVADFKVGDRVVASGTQSFCPGWTADGGYATHCLLDAGCLLPLAETVSFVQGAAATDAGQTSHHAVMVSGELKAGQRVGIIGLGGLGMTGARIAVLAGAEVYAAEPRKEAWAIAREQGVREVVEDAKALAQFEPDLVVDFAGFAETTADAISAVRPGGLVVQVGLGVTEVTIPKMQLVNKSVTLRGSSGGTPEDTAAVLAHMASGDLTITATAIGFDDIPQALERLKRGGVVGRIVAEPMRVCVRGVDLSWRKMHMKAWLFTGADRPLEFVERAMPRPSEGEVLIEARGSGLCHSDVGRMDGTLTPFMPKKPPIILGHEVAGVVIGTGPGVADFAMGDRVVASGTQKFCPGRDADGGYATHCLLPRSCLLHLPDEVSFVQGAAATDAGQTSHHAVMVAGQLRAGQRVGIVGLGGLGMTGARIAVVHGAEPRREAWSAAKAQGLREVVEDVTQLARYEPDLIVDFAGFRDTTSGAIAAVRNGGRAVQVGLGETEAKISRMQLVTKSVTLRGSAGGRPSDTAAVLEMVARGELTIEATEIRFDGIPDGLNCLERGGVVGRIVAAL